jgi:hypothetical protein
MTAGINLHPFVEVNTAFVFRTTLGDLVTQLVYQATNTNQKLHEVMLREAFRDNFLPGRVMLFITTSAISTCPLLV